MSSSSSEAVTEALRSCLRRYDEAYQLLNEEGKNDPENEPYRSQYAAKHLLEQVKRELTRLSDSIAATKPPPPPPAASSSSSSSHNHHHNNDPNRDSADDQQRGTRTVTADQLCVAVAAIDYRLGVIGVDTEELSTGEEHLLKCLRSLDLFGIGLMNVMVVVDDDDTAACPALDRSRILTAAQALNQLGVLASLRGEAELSERYLKRAETLCERYRREIALAPCSLRDLLARLVPADDQDVADTQSEANWQLLEDVLTHTFYYLAQVHNSLGKTKSAAAYCHTTLRRQLESGKFEPVEWSVNAATLSQHFVMHNDFRTARHHLACAEHVLNEHAARSSTSSESGEESGEAAGSSPEERLERLRGRRADVARCWAKYGMLLLSVSWDERMRRSVGAVSDGLDELRLGSGGGDGGGETVASAPGGQVAAHNGAEDDGLVSDEYGQVSGSKSDMRFELPEASVIEEQVTWERVSDFDQARPVFLNAQKWLQSARDYYTMQEHASDHVEIVQDASKLYKLLSYFEPCADRRCKMHKRRVDLLESALASISPTYYLNACRQMQFELGETYSEMLDLKWTLYRDAPPVNNAARKVNHLAEQSIKFFQAFIDTFLDAQGKVPDQFPEELLRAALLANFCVGRLHAKLVTTDVRTQIANLRLALERYDYVRQYCERHPAAVQVFREEWEVSREMSRLLPVKMDKLLQLHSRSAAAAN